MARAKTSSSSLTFLLCVSLALVCFNHVSALEFVQAKEGNGYSQSTATNQKRAARVQTTTTVKGPYQPIGITHHGGRSMSRGINLYIIWYGKWSNTSKAIVRGFVTDLGSTNKAAGTVRGWWKTIGVYYNTLGQYFNQSVVLNKEVVDKYSSGTLVKSDNVVNKIIAPKLGSQLPVDYNGIYLVLFGEDANVRHLLNLFENET